MPITFLPQIPTFVGPGGTISVQTSLIGPIDPLGVWRINIFPDLSSELIPMFWQVPSDTGNQGILGPAQTFNVDVAGVSLQQGQQCSAQVQLINSLGTVEDESDRIPVTWDGAGQLAVWQQFRPQGGGLTTEEHQWLDTTQSAVQAFFRAVGGALAATPIGTLLTHPDPSLFTNAEGCQQISGSGSLSLPSGGIDFDTYGVIVGFDVVPAGFGFREGVEREYFERIVQLAPIYNTFDGLKEYVGQFVDFRQTGQIYVWRQFRPIGLAFNVTPGCLVSLCWLTT